MSMYGYYTDYYALLLIPAGALLFATIKRLSDFGALNRKLNIRVGEQTNCVDIISANKRTLTSALKRARQLNNAVMAVTGLPPTVAEFVKALENETGTVLHPPEVCNAIGSAAATQQDVTGARLYMGLVCSSDSPYREACGRVLYEKAMGEGTLAAKREMSLREFLNSGGALCYSDMQLLPLQQRARRGTLKLCAIGGVEMRMLDGSASLYDRGCALLLFLRLSNAAEVMRF